MSNMTMEDGRQQRRSRKPATAVPEKASWSLLEVAQAVREHGRALGERRQVSVTAREWRTHRDRLTREIFDDLNRRAFGHGLPDTLEVVWSPRLLTTAGRSINSWTQYGPRVRMSKVELAAKVVDDPVKLLNTLGHELCHAATWVISKSSEGHGRVWGAHMRAVHALYPGFDLSTRHGYVIHKPYRWSCSRCTSLEERHSKSLDTAKTACKVCGARGQFKYLGKFNKDGHSSSQSTATAAGQQARPLNPYAQFTKDNMAAVTASLPAGTPQKVKMQELSRRWQAHKQSLESLRSQTEAFLRAEND
jgi:predicted SprT family Zn-dependent metalloprotease